MPFQIVKDNILALRCEAIVDPTDPRMSGAVGLDALVQKFAGEEFTQNCRQRGPLAFGEAILTPSPRLRCGSVILTAVPWWSGQTEELELLRRCYRNALLLAREHGIGSLALPLIGASTRGFPPELVLKTAEEEIRSFLMENEEAEVTLVVFDMRMYRPDAERLAGLERYLERMHRADQALQAQEDMLANAATGAFPAITAADIRREEARQRLDDLQPTEAALPGVTCERRRRISALAPAARPKEKVGAAQPFGSFRPERGAVLDESFSEMVLRKIDERGFKKDSDCYSRANIDKRLFSKIRCDAAYHPKKTTAVALAVALELPLDETKELLMKAGYSLSHSILFDLIVEYCIEQRNYDIFSINELLFQYDQPLLGG